MFLHDVRCALGFAGADGVQDLPVLGVVLVDRTRIQCQVAHPGPVILAADMGDLVDDPDQQSVAGGAGQGAVKLGVDLGEGHRIIGKGFHPRAQRLHLVEIGAASMQHRQPADMRLKRESRVHQFQRCGVINRVRRRIGRHVSHICTAACAGFDIPLTFKQVERLSDGAPGGAIRVCQHAFGW